MGLVLIWDLLANLSRKVLFLNRVVLFLSLAFVGILCRGVLFLNRTILFLNLGSFAALGRGDLFLSRAVLFLNWVFVVILNREVLILGWILFTKSALRSCYSGGYGAAASCSYGRRGGRGRRAGRIRFFVVGKSGCLGGRRESFAAASAGSVSRYTDPSALD
jgi:hypothetical protein